MNKIIKKVPAGIQYMSDWEDYDFPGGHCIVDKGVTGCGYTELCLRNDLPVILCSPRKLLLQNKSEQHMEDGNWNVLYLENKNEDDDKLKVNFGVINSGLDLEKKWTQEIYHHLQKCQGANEDHEVRAPKFLVTYDSLRHLLKCLQDLQLNLGDFYFVVDEMQSIFLDAFFKASTEFSFVEYLQVCPNVLYLSATPMLDKYLEKVPEFKDLPFYVLDWRESGCVENIKVSSKKISSISGECVKIIKRFQAGIYPISINLKGETIESKEAVFYLNSVADIIRTIKKCNLKPSEVNIICANTKENKAKLNKLSKDLGYDTTNGFKIGKVPTKKEKNKKYTFCTRSVYMGADFYSVCASSYVFSDPNIKCLALDISMDLPQIVGRQRYRENPFKNTISVFYKTTGIIQSREEFDRIQEERLKSTNKLLNLYQKADLGEKVEYIQKLRSDIQVSQYSRDFVSISSKTGHPVHNKFIELADERAWEVSQKDYQDRIAVTKVMEEKGYLVSEDNNQDNVPEDFKMIFEETMIFTEKLKIYCEYLDSISGDLRLTNMIKFYVKDPDYQKFYEFYGTSGCKAKKFRRSDLEEGMRSNINSMLIADSLFNLFVVGERYSTKYIKELLRGLYSSLGISKTPKAVDLEEYFNLESAKVLNIKTGKRENGFKIVSKKCCI